MAQNQDGKPPKRISLSDMDATKYMTFGSLFILAVDTTLFPLDTLKTIIMSDRGKKAINCHSNNSQKSLRPNIFRMALGIARKEGLFRFWRGVVPSTIGNFPGQASYYLAYESAQEAMTHLLPDQNSSRIGTFLRGFFSGMAAEVSGTKLN